MTFRAYAATAFAAFAMLAGTAQANLVTNPGFETGLTGWDCSVDPAAVAGCGWTNLPAEGVWTVVVYADGSAGTLSQLLSTVAGTTYSIKFQSFADAPVNTLSVSVGDLLDETAPNFSDYAGFSATFVASGASTLLSFNFSTQHGMGGVYIDDVVVEAQVPEPGSLALMGLAFAAAAGLARRRHAG